MEEETKETTAPETEEKKKPNYLVIGIIAAIALLIGWLLFRNTGTDTTAEGTPISGTVDFNGIKPGEEAEERAKLVLMQREAGQGEFEATDADVPMEDGGEWIWTGAEEGVTYNLRLDLFVDDQYIKPSNTITTTAPATNQVLTMNVTAKDLPNYVVEELAVSISGLLDLDGLIPEGSTVTIQEKLVDEPAYEDAVTDIPAVDGGKWSWDEALNGQEYMITGFLFDSEGTVIGESKPISVVAPASNEVIAINSGVTSEEGQKATISGNVYLQGPVIQDSTVLILARLPEEIDYDDVQRIPAVNAEPFEWKGAVAGQSYYISAVLQVEGDNVSQGNEIFTKAPASGLRITIDTQASLDQPPVARLFECSGPDSAGGYNAKVLYDKIDGSAAYYMTVGSAAGNDDVFKEAVKANTLTGDPESVTYIEPGETQYAQYSYTFCTDCDVYDTMNWSPFSPTLGFTCPME